VVAPHIAEASSLVRARVENEEVIVPRRPAPPYWIDTGWGLRNWQSDRRGLQNELIICSTGRKAPDVGCKISASFVGQCRISRDFKHEILIFLYVKIEQLLRLLRQPVLPF
jgi:hypothetical protein